jgi:tRNA modification GTPase
MKPDIIVAVATAPGRSGIGMVRVSGPDLAALAQGLVGRHLEARRATLSDFLGENGESIDRGIALFFPAPQSYTGEDVLELHGHGGPVVLRRLLSRCIELGARAAEPGEFTQRAYLNDKLDLAQAEAVADLIEASTTEAARCALRSLQGEFSQRITELLQELIDLRVLVETTLDFPEEEIDFVKQADIQRRLRGLQKQVGAVLEASREGSLLREGMQVALIGQPNVGKSSLLNRLAGEEIAIVTPLAGTTRDAIRLSVDLAGVPVHFTDTAGLRVSDHPVEKLGIARTWSVVQQADVAVLIMEAGGGETSADREVLGRVPASVPCMRVYNTIDLTGHAPAVVRERGITTVWLSALTGAGVDGFRNALLALAGWGGRSEGLYIARARHVQALDTARIHLGQAIGVTERLELLAEELRLTQEALSAITGGYTSDELLGEIFSRFCVGK